MKARARTADSHNERTGVAIRVSGGRLTHVRAGTLPFPWAKERALPATQTPRTRLMRRLLLWWSVLCVCGLTALGEPGTRPVAAAGTWLSAPPLLTPTTGLGAALGPDGRIYAIGGASANGVLNTVEAYTPGASRWQLRAPMPTARAALGVATGIDGRIYAIGGDSATGQVLSIVEAYDPRANTWQSRAGMSTARDLAGVVTGQDGRIYVIGGFNGVSALNTLEAYDPRTNTWATLAPMPTPRWGLAVAVSAAGRIYAIGGTAGVQWYNTVEVYDLPTNRWTSVAPLPAPRGYLAAAMGAYGQISAIGGVSYVGSGNGAVDTVDVYDPSTNSWHAGTNLPNARRYLAAVRAGSSLYAIGGDDYHNHIYNSNDEYHTAQLSVNPSQGVVGQSITLTGTNFSPNEPVSVYADTVGGTPIYTATTDGAGSFVLSTTVVPLSYGIHQLVAVGGHSDATGQTTFTVEAQPNLSPSAGAAGTQTAATGTGFGAHETVALHWGTPAGPLLGATTTDATGSFGAAGAITFTVPSSAPGTVPVYVVGQSSGAQAVADFTVR